jgi:asparagine synthase (glutamine-hydrolysing)
MECAVHRFSIAPGWFLTCLDDGHLSRTASSDEEITIEELPAASLSSTCGGQRAIDVRFSRRTLSLDIQKDPVSGRTIYYLVNENGDFFASTHISLLRKAGIQIRENPEFLPELLVFRMVSPPNTIFQGIRQVQFGAHINARLSNEGVVISEEIRGSAQQRCDSPQVEPMQRVVDALNDALLKLTPAGPQMATLLSGGLDSSILALIARDRLRVQNTYSTSHPLDRCGNLEQEYALSAAAALSTRHSLFVPTLADFLKGTLEAIAACESPLHHLQSVLLYLLFKHGIPPHVHTMICGEGADCIFGNSTHFLLRLRNKRLIKFLGIVPGYAFLRQLGGRWEKTRAFSDILEKVGKLHLPNFDPRNPIWTDGAYGDFDWVEEIYGCSRDEIITRRMSEFESFLNLGLADSITISTLNSDVAATTAIWSKLAESQGKVMYYPFVDSEVRAASFSIPWDVKLRSEKHVIREVGRQLKVPALILNRPKQSFGVVSNLWAERDGPLEPLVTVAAKAVDLKLLRSLQGRNPRRAMTLWNLLNYAILIRLFVRGEPLDRLLDELRESTQIRSLDYNHCNHPRIAVA